MGNVLNEGQRELVRESWARVVSFRRLAGEVVCGGKLADAAASLESLARALCQLDIIPYSRIRTGKQRRRRRLGLLLHDRLDFRPSYLILIRDLSCRTDPGELMTTQMSSFFRRTNGENQSSPITWIEASF